VIHTFGSFIKCSTDTHIGDLIDLNSVSILCPGACEKTFGAGKPSSGAAQRIALFQDKVADSTGYIAVDASNENGFAIASW